MRKKLNELVEKTYEDPAKKISRTMDAIQIYENSLATKEDANAISVISVHADESEDEKKTISTKHSTKNVMT